MLKKFLAMSLTVVILSTVSGSQVLAASSGDEKAKAAIQEKSVDKFDLKSVVKAKTDSADLTAEKNTLAGYQKNKAQGKKFSTTTKVLIGVGIAVAVVGIVVFAASRDKIRTF